MNGPKPALEPKPYQDDMLHQQRKMDTRIYAHDHYHHLDHKDLLAALMAPAMHQDPLQQQSAPSMSFQSSSGPSSGSQGSNTPLSPSSNLQHQLTMNMFNNMMQTQGGEQLVGMAGQYSPGSSASNAPYNPQAIFVEQQFKLSQLQQLQQLQAQIFQQQFALISGQPFLPTNSSPMNRSDLSNALSLPSMKDQGSSSPHNSAGPPYAGLPTPGPSSELRPRDNPMDYVSPMILNNSFLESPLSTHSSHHIDNLPFSHQHHGTHSPHYNASHPHTAPPHIAFNIQPTIHTNSASPIFNTGDGPPSSTISNTSPMPSGAELDIDISPITSPWLTAAGNQHHHQQSQNRTDSGLRHHHVRSASFSHSSGAPSTRSSKRPADGSSGSDPNDQPGHSSGVNNVFESSEPLRKKQSLNSSSATRGGNPPLPPHPSQYQQHHHLTPLSLLPQSTSPLISPTSASSTGLSSATTGTGANSSSSPSISGSGTLSHRKATRASRSASNTPLMHGQRSKAGNATRAQANVNASNSGSGINATMSFALPPHAMRNGSSSVTGTPSTPSIGVGGGLSVIGIAVDDTPSPVDLDLSMPPPAPPDHINNTASNSNSTASSGSGSGDGIDSGRDLSPEMNGMGPGGMLLPVTPAIIMKLDRLAPANGNAGGGHGHVSGMNAPRSWTGEAGGTGPTVKEKRSRGAEKGGANEKEREGGAKGKGAPGTAVTAVGVAAGRTRRSTVTVPVGGSGLKTILPANNPNPSSPHIPASGATSRHDQQQQPRKITHKDAEQKRRDSLKSAYDELRMLLPPIPLPSGVDDATGANGNGVIPGISGVWPPRSSSSLPGSLPPRGPPKTGAEGPNKGVSKLQLLICGNELIRVLRARVERRNDEIGRLRSEVGKLRSLLREMKLGGSGGTDEDGRNRDVEMHDVEFGFDLDLDLERDLDAVEIHSGDGEDRAGVGMGTGATSMSVLGSVDEQPGEDDEDE